MGKKILSAMLIVASLFWGSPAYARRAPKAPAASHEVKVILNDGTIINGELLGQDNGIISIQNDDGKSQDIAVSKIKKMFDADGKVVALSSASDSVKEEAPQAEEEAPAPKKARRAAPRRSNGMKTAGTIMAYSGLGVGLIGVLIWAAGYSEMSNAVPSTYTTTPGYATDGNYYYYTIPGYSGKYYTYDEYSNYTINYAAGEGWAWTGGTIAVVGLAVGITGVILSASGNRKALEQDSLMHLEDNQLTWGLPQVQLMPNNGERMTLLNARF